MFSHPESATDNRRLCQRRVDHSIWPELLKQADSCPEGSARPSDILHELDDSLVTRHGIVKCSC